MGLDERKSSVVEVLDSVHEVIDENLSNLVEGVEEVGTSREVSKDLGSNKELKEKPKEVKVQEKCDELSAVDQGTSYSSSNLVNHGVVETVVVIDAVNVQTEGMKLEAKADESGLSLVSMKAPKGVCETDKDSCVIDMKCSSHKGFYEVSQGEKICRICHLTFGQSSDAISDENGSATSGDFIQLGCSCKDELGIAHIHCAEVWFKLKGNRLCEICGETAKNVSVVANNGFMEGWNDRRFMDNDVSNSSQHRFGGCWRGQPFCNFLMACLVIAFILPWFFHVNIF